MSATRTIWLVARRELVERAATKGYLIGTAITVLIVVGAIVAPTFFGSDGPDEFELGVVGEAPADLDEQLAATALEGTSVATRTFGDREAAVDAIEAGDVDAALVDRAELVADGTPNMSLTATLEAALQASALQEGLADAGIDPAELAAATTPPAPLRVVDLAGDEGGGGDGFVLAFIATILLFIGIQGNGATLLSAALEEKSSRVVEVLVSVARPWQLLGGKLIALTILALAQLAVTVAAGLAANAAVDAFELPAATGALIAISLLMLIIGFLFYASLFAVAGSMAASLEDAQSTSGPLTFAVMGGYFAVIFAVLPNPDGIVAQVLTYVPPTAPFVVPARVAFDAIAGWEVALASVTTLIVTLLVVRVAGRLYAGALLSGGKLSWSAAWRAEPVR